MNEIEKQFMEAFGIEPRIMTEPRYSLNSEYYEVTVKDYPQITDYILLELMCIFHNSPICFGGINLNNVDVLKERLLIQLTKIMNNDIHDERKNKLKRQVQALFKENI